MAQFSNNIIFAAPAGSWVGWCEGGVEDGGENLFVECNVSQCKHNITTPVHYGAKLRQRISELEP